MRDEMGWQDYGRSAVGGGGFNSAGRFGFSPYEGLAAGGALGGLLGSLFGQDPYEAAGKYWDQIPGVLQQTYGPYMQEGQRDLPILSGQYGRLLNDPSGFISEMGSKYKQSPGYQYQVDEATKAANQAAAAGGMLGSPAEQAALAQRVSGIASQDYQKYLDRVLGAYGQGLQGYKGLEEQGYGAAGEYGGNLTNYLASRADMARAQAESQRQRMSGIGSLLGGAAGMAGGYL